ncbi:hypothetical protein ACXR2T_12065 [Leucobacter sp. HY1910]
MAQVKDSRVLLTGTVVDLEEDFAFEDGTRKLRGHKIVVNSGDGMSVVKLFLDAPISKPSLGDTVLWWVRPTPWAMDGGRSGMSVRLLETATASELAALAELAV